MNTDIFKGMDIRGKFNTDITKETVWNIGKALADWLSTSGSVLVMSGNGSKELVAAMIEGLRLQGRDVVFAENGDKMVLAETIVQKGYSGGVLIGYDELGDEVSIELYKEDGRLVDNETGLGEIAVLAEAGNFVPASAKGELN
jgi:phosphomannomutase